MRAYTESQRAQWELFLPIFEFVIKNAVSLATSIISFFANFGKHPHITDALLVDGKSLPSSETIVGQDLKQRLQHI